MGMPQLPPIPTRQTSIKLLVVMVPLQALGIMTETADDAKRKEATVLE